MGGASEEIAIIGSGGIGGFIAAELAGAGRSVTLCVRTPFEQLIVTSGGATREVAVPQVSDPARATPARWILLTTKGQDTASAKPWIDAIAGPDTTLVMVQNGIGHLERARPIAGPADILPAIIYCSVERTQPGRIVHHSGARIVVPREDRGSALAGLFEGTRFEIVQSDDFRTAAWRKLFANLAANPMTALTLRRMTMFHEVPAQELARAILGEALAVSGADGATLTGADVDGIVANYAGWQTESGTSMFYDRLSGRSLEHEHITGALVEAADRYGIPVPVNRTILALLAVASGHQFDGSA